MSESTFILSEEQYGRLYLVSRSLCFVGGLASDSEVLPIEGNSEDLSCLLFLLHENMEAALEGADFCPACRQEHTELKNAEPVGGTQ